VTWTACEVVYISTTRGQLTPTDRPASERLVCTIIDKLIRRIGQKRGRGGLTGSMNVLTDCFDLRRAAHADDDDDGRRRPDDGLTDGRSLHGESDD